MQYAKNRKEKVAILKIAKRRAHSVAAKKNHSPLFVGVVPVMKDLDQGRQV
jgi:hypothetical protein